jgi:hypothetical protein
MLEKGINKRSDGAGFRENNNPAHHEQKQYNGEKPESFSNPQEFPKLTNERLISHLFPLKTVLEISPRVVPPLT